MKFILAVALAISAGMLAEGSLVIRFILAAVVFAVTVAGCSFFDSGIDVEHKQDGTRVFLDTPRMWQDWARSVDKEISREISYGKGTAEGDPLKGKPNGGGTWNEYWIDRIKSVNSQDNGHRQEHAQRYVDYIIKQRQIAGLPALVGYQ
jgi:hypothetical protein